jgi:hypothetical protein
MLRNAGKKFRYLNVELSMLRKVVQKSRFLNVEAFYVKEARKKCPLS